MLLEKTKVDQLNFFYHPLPYQVSSKDPSGLISLSSKGSDVLIASIEPIFKVYKQCNKEEVKALKLNPNEPVPQEYTKTLLLPYKVDKETQERLNINNENPIYDNFNCSKEGFISPSFTASKDSSNYKELDIFSLEDAKELNKLHIKDFDGKTYYLVYDSYHNYLGLMNEQLEKGNDAYINKRIEILKKLIEEHEDFS